MAEAVLAQLTIDESGVISGIARVDNSLRRGEQAVDRFGSSQTRLVGVGDKAIRNFFSMDRALTRLGAAFGIAGLVYSLANAITSLVTELITSETWFKRSKEAVTDWWNELVKGETTVERIARKTAALKNIPSGPVGELEKLRSLVEERKELIRLMEETGKAAQAESVTERSFLGIIPSLATGRISGLFGEREDISASGSFAALQKQVEVADKAIRDLFNSLRGHGLTAKEIIDATGASIKALPPTPEDMTARKKYLDDILQALGAVDEMRVSMQSAADFQAFFGPAERVELFEVAGIPNPVEFAHQIDLIKEAISELNVQLSQGGIPVEQFNIGVENLQDALKSLGFTAEETRAIFESLGVSLNTALPGPETFSSILAGYGQSLSTAQAQFEAFMVAVQGVGLVISESLAGSDVNLRQAIVSILKQISNMLIVYALMFTAMGIASSTNPVAIGLFGSPDQNFAAAQVFAAAGAAAGLAARALGGGGQGEGGRGGGGRGGGRASVSGLGGGQQSVTVVVQGSFIGSDPNEIARYLSDIITTNRRDGTR